MSEKILKRPPTSATRHGKGTGHGVSKWGASKWGGSNGFGKKKGKPSLPAEQVSPPVEGADTSEVA